MVTCQQARVSTVKFTFPDLTSFFFFDLFRYFGLSGFETRFRRRRGEENWGQFLAWILGLLGREFQYKSYPSLTL